MSGFQNNKDAQFQSALTQFGIGCSPFDNTIENTKIYLQDICNFLSPSDKDDLCSNFTVESNENNQIHYQFNNILPINQNNLSGGLQAASPIPYNELYVVRRSQVVSSPSLSSSVPVANPAANSTSNTDQSDSGSLSSNIPSMFLGRVSDPIPEANSNAPSVSKVVETAAKPAPKRPRKRPSSQSIKPVKASAKSGQALKELKSFPLVDTFDTAHGSYSCSPTHANAELSLAGASVAEGLSNASEAPGLSRQPDKVKQMEDELREKLKRLQFLQNENAELKFRHNLLEQLVGLRSHQMSVMAGHGGAAPLPPLQHFTDTMLQATTPGAGLHSLLGSRVMRSVFSPSERDRLSRISRDSFVGEWKIFLAEASVCLLALESNPEDVEAASRLEHLCNQCAYMCKHTCLLAPHTLLQVLCTQLETSETDNLPTPEHWHALVPIIDFTRDQEMRLFFVHELFSKVMRKVIEERRELQNELHQGLQTAMDINRAMRQIELHPECLMLKRLHRNLHRELCMHDLMRGYFFGRTLTTLQFARLAVYSYPYYPDSTAIICALADMRKAEQIKRANGAEEQG